MKFRTAEDLQAAIDSYFHWCDSQTAQIPNKDGELITVPNPKPYTVSGLAVYLGTSRRVLLNYEKMEQKPEYVHAIKTAKQKIESFVEESLWKPKIAPGVIFNLKNNFGWKDQQSVELTNPDGSLGGMRIQVNFVVPEQIAAPVRQIEDVIEGEFEGENVTEG